ncbi:TPA: transposase [Staphylococcus aureus]|uniref:helix-turn-helix domain-containing protein n=1 Tax=Staphylococcus aureus TaxID=1280 RepID=UPI0013030714|nr:helix-turn-helix domain-containing protein [Staphylococcus aureus]HAR2858377.1 transposase [Staphylococcus aureus]HAR2942590.1 transposase [Staphylococcus aureus]
MTKKRKWVEIDFNTRLAIAKYLNDGLKIVEIARILDRNYEVVRSEIKRFKKDGHYNPLLAQEEAVLSRKRTEEDKANRRKLDSDIKAYIEEKLSLQWSPRQIAKRIEKDIGVYVSYPTIYRYIREGLVKFEKKDLRQGGKKYNKTTEKRGKIKVGERAIMYRPTFRK